MVHVRVLASGSLLDLGSFKLERDNKHWLQTKYGPLQQATVQRKNRHRIVIALQGKVCETPVSFSIVVVTVTANIAYTTKVEVAVAVTGTSWDVLKFADDKRLILPVQA